MRAIDYIVLHCTATSQSTTIDSILHYWRKALGWKNPGYHYMIKADGEIVQLLPIEQASNGVKGYNHNSIHISYVGGVDAKGNAMDTRTKAQKISQIKLVLQFKKQFPKAKIKGHRDFPGVKKACPAFDVAKWLQGLGIKN